MVGGQCGWFRKPNICRRGRTHYARHCAFGKKIADHGTSLNRGKELRQAARRIALPHKNRIGKW